MNYTGFLFDAGDMFPTNFAVLISKMKLIFLYHVKIFHKHRCPFFNISSIVPNSKVKFDFLKYEPMYNFENIAFNVICSKNTTTKVKTKFLILISSVNDKHQT